MEGCCTFGRSLDSRLEGPVRTRHPGYGEGEGRPVVRMDVSLWELHPPLGLDLSPYRMASRVDRASHGGVVSIEIDLKSR